MCETTAPASGTACPHQFGTRVLEEVKTLAEATKGLPEGGTPFDISAVPFLFSGQRIPHHRAPRERESETIVVAQFYAPLLPLHADALDQPPETGPDPG